jgi:hypothetical protein
LIILGTIVAWLTVIPLAGATISRVITLERISDWPRAQIELRWPRGLIHYLSQCPICMSYWTTTGCSAAAWWALEFRTTVGALIVWALLTLAAIRLANFFAAYGRSSQN